MKTTVARTREPNSNFCHLCRKWVESQERVNAFAHANGARQAVHAWTCPACLSFLARAESVVGAGGVDPPTSPL